LRQTQVNERTQSFQKESNIGKKMALEDVHEFFWRPGEGAESPENKHSQDLFQTTREAEYPFKIYLS